MNCIKKEDSVVDFKEDNVTLMKEPKVLVLNTENFTLNAINKYYEKIKKANIFFASKENLQKSCCLLNLNNDNISRINELIYGKKNKIEFELVNLAFNQNNMPDSFCGYGELQY